jgi:hypothetical protein
LVGAGVTVKHLARQGPAKLFLGGSEGRFGLGQFLIFAANRLRDLVEFFCEGVEALDSIRVEELRDSAYEGIDRASFICFSRLLKFSLSQ